MSYCKKHKFKNTLQYLVVVVDDLGDGRQAVGGAGGVGDDVHRGVVLVLEKEKDIFCDLQFSVSFFKK